MAKAAKSKKRASVKEAAADYFAARSHNGWRKKLLETNPEQRGKPRMRLRRGAMVDVNKPWTGLHPKAKAENKQAAYDAYDAVMRFPDDREAASAYVHECWVKRNRADSSQPKALFRPYAKLPEVEKDKDRAHVDLMKKAIASVTRKKRAAKKSKAAPAYKTIRVDAKAWARLEAAAKDLSKALGRKVAPEALFIAGVEAVAAAAKRA